MRPRWCSSAVLPIALWIVPHFSRRRTVAGCFAGEPPMNAPLHREIPAGVLDAAAALAHASDQWDRDIVRQLTDYIAIPAKSPGFDTDWAAARPHRDRAAQRRRLGRGAEGRGPEAGDRAPARPHAGAVLRDRGHARGRRCRADRADVRPPGQAAGVQRLARRPGPLDAQVRGRQALWPRRRRRRLCGLRQHRRGAGAQGAEGAAPAHRRPDRDLRGIAAPTTCCPMSTRCARGWATSAW